MTLTFRLWQVGILKYAYPRTIILKPAVIEVKQDTVNSRDWDVKKCRVPVLVRHRQMLSGKFRILAILKKIQCSEPLFFV